MKLLLLSLLLLTSFSYSQDLPFREIPPNPDSYTEGTVVARITEGLGFRYYWATEGLRSEDLDFRPSEGARSLGETLVHLYGLTRFINDTVLGNTIQVSRDYEQFDFETLRRETLALIESISTLLRSPDFTPPAIKFPANKDGVVNELPFWNLLNGPISDALYHTGQVVSFRRTSGNPINPNINVFTGQVRDEK